MVIQYGWGPDDSPTIYHHGNAVIFFLHIDDGEKSLLHFKGCRSLAISTNREMGLYLHVLFIIVLSSSDAELSGPITSCLTHTSRIEFSKFTRKYA